MLAQNGPLENTVAYWVKPPKTSVTLPNVPPVRVTV